MNDGLSDEELTLMSQQLPNLHPAFKGVFTKDMMPDLRDREGCVIVNLETSQQDGSHWVACGNKAGQGWYFDSFGLDVPIPIRKHLPKLTLRENDEIQAEASDMCGLYALAACYAVTTSRESAARALKKFESLFKKPVLDDNDAVLVAYFKHIMSL
jgi:hypothetical protein